MSSNHREALGGAPVSKWDSRQRRNRDRGTNSGNQLHLNAMFERERPFFRAPSKNNRIAALQACSSFARERMTYDQIENLGLRLFLLPVMLANVDQLRIGSGKFKDLRGYQAVVKDHVRLPQRTNGLERQEFRIARSSTDQDQLSLVAFRFHTALPE